MGPPIIPTKNKEEALGTLEQIKDAVWYVQKFFSYDNQNQAQHEFKELERLIAKLKVKGGFQ